MGVALPLPMDRLFTYRVPAALIAQAMPGHRVAVPFRGRQRIGFVVEQHTDTDLSRVLDIADAPDPAPLLDPQQIQLGRFIARYYGASLGEALTAMVPHGVRHRGKGRKATHVTLGPEAPQDAEDGERFTPAQQRVLRQLLAAPEGVLLTDLQRSAGVSRSPLTTLAKRGVLTLAPIRIPSDPLRAEAQAPVARELEPALTEHQAEALARIETALAGGTYAACLLYGVTGSGKTEVYLRALRRVVDAGKQGIVLVPEIALTPQTVRRFRRRFDRVEVLHSAMTEAERAAAWRRIHGGEAQVVIGPRSAVFAPVRALGLIVVDEEHEGSFKQQHAPRYHARDVALVRASMHNALVILGSATPALESWHNAEAGKYLRLDLPERVAGRMLPTVRVVDIRDTDERPPPGQHLGRTLMTHLELALAEGGQVMLFQNRRGYATSVSCPRCGDVASCPHCSVGLTYHRTSQAGRCHLCGYGTRIEPSCLACGLPDLRLHGVGTQTLEQELATRLPDATVGRMDSDTMVARGAHERMLQRFGSGEIDILIGTQMIAKGLDFPNVTLVGIVSADTALALPDFRAAERTFHLLAQVAGRTGRGDAEGRVVIQTRLPEHFAIQAAAAQDYPRFAHAEMADRKSFGYPPHRRLLRVLIRGAEARSVESHAVRVHAQLVAAALRATQILGPAPAPIERMQGRVRHHLLVKAQDHREVHRLVGALRQLPRAPRGVDVVWDVDPLSLL